MYRLESWKYLVHHNTQYHMKVLLGSFHLNGYTLGFHPQIFNLQERHVFQHNKQYKRKVLLNSFHLNGHTLGFYAQT